MRTALLWLATATVSTLLSATVVLVGLALFVRHAERQGRNVEPPGLRHNKLMRMLFERKDFLRFVDVVTKTEPESFRTSWDFDKGTHLSREQYVPTDMHGHESYRHKANIRITDVALWSGLYRARMTVRETPDVREALRKCLILNEISYETDALGFKKTEFSSEDGLPAVLFLGDSFTEGLHVRSEDTFVNLFGRKMREAGIAAVPVNAGVNGYGVPEELWTAETYAARLNTRVIVENLFLNDAGEIDDVLENENPRGNYVEMFSYLDRLRAFCLREHMDLIVSVVPSKEQMGGEPRYFQRRVHSWCAETGVPFVNPLGYFQANGAGTHYFSWDPHLNAKGHRHYASFLFQEVLPILRQRFSGERMSGVVWNAPSPTGRRESPELTESN